WNFTSDTMPASDITLYANWDTQNYTVTFNSNGGSAVGNQTINYQAKVTQPANPNRDGYTFGGWYKEEALTNAWNFATDTMPSNAITLYAKWNANTCTLDATLDCELF
ncbi:InlB B-repeat-containing protein, partial [Candidatus Gracilibacteria bacterium]|nr:InlB B-repeat-containing protein [Candidatus Gracilibacteria bacterium]